MTPSPWQGLRGSFVGRMATLLLVSAAVITASLGGAHGRDIPVASVARRAGGGLVAHRWGSRVLQEEKQEDGDSEDAAAKDEAAAEESEPGVQGKKQMKAADMEPAEDGEQAPEQQEEKEDSAERPLHGKPEANDRDAETAIVDPEERPPQRKGGKKRDSIGEDGGNSAEEMEIVGRGDEERPEEVPPELVANKKKGKTSLPSESESAEQSEESESEAPKDVKFKRGSRGSEVGEEQPEDLPQDAVQPGDKSETSNDVVRSKGVSGAGKTEEEHPEDSEQEAAKPSDEERTEEEGTETPPKKRSKEREQPLEKEQLEASQAGGDEEGDNERMPPGKGKRGRDPAVKEGGLDDPRLSTRNAEEGGEREAGEGASAEGGEGASTGEEVMKKARMEEAEENSEEGAQSSEEPQREGVKGIAETAEAREKEDSGNSGVADEIALADGGAAKVEVENFGGEVPDPLEVEVGAPEALALEEAALEDEEDYASFMSELVNAGQRLTPAMQGLKEKTEKHVVPKVQELARTGHAAFMKTSDKILDHVAPFLGPSLSPVVATLLSVLLLLLPLGLVGLLVYQIRFIVTLQRVLVLCNLYLFLYCFALLSTCIIMSGEPMRSLMRAAEPNFFVLQFFVVLGYLAYLGLQFWWLGTVVRTKGKDRDPIVMSKAALQCTVAVGIALHYYIFVFERALLDKPPRITAWGYLVYSLLFLLLTLIGRPRDSQVDVGKHT